MSFKDYFYEGVGRDSTIRRLEAIDRGLVGRGKKAKETSDEIQKRVRSSTAKQDASNALSKIPGHEALAAKLKDEHGAEDAVNRQDADDYTAKRNADYLKHRDLEIKLFKRLTPRDAASIRQLRRDYPRDSEPAIPSSEINYQKEKKHRFGNPKKASPSRDTRGKKIKSHDKNFNRVPIDKFGSRWASSPLKKEKQERAKLKRNAKIKAVIRKVRGG